MESAPTAFKPKGFWEIVGDSFKTYFTSIAEYIGIAAVMIVPVALCSGALWAIGDFTRTAADGWSSNLSKWLVTDFLFPAGTLLLSMLTYPLMHGALIHATAQKRLGHPIDVGQAYLSAFRRAGSLIGTWLVISVLISAMLVSLICLAFALSQDIAWLYILTAVLATGIPFALYLTIKWLFVLQAVMLEGRPITQTIPRSGSLVTGNWWRSFGIWALFTVIVPFAAACICGLVLTIGTLLRGFGDSATFGEVVFLSIFPALAVVPLSTVAGTLLYFDLRARKEAYGPRMMAGELRQAPAQDPTRAMPEHSPQEQARPAWQPRSLNPLLILLAVVALLAALVPPTMLLLPNHVDRGDIQLSARRVSTGSQVRVDSHGDLRTIDFTDFALVVDFNGHVEHGDQENSVMCNIKWWEDQWTKTMATVRVFAQEGTVPDGSYGYLATPENDPANEVSTTIEILDEEHILVSPIAGEFPSRSQIVLELDFGDGSGWCERMFTL